MTLPHESDNVLLLLDEGLRGLDPLRNADAHKCISDARQALPDALRQAQLHRPPERPDAHCLDCPFSDRGDWLIYRDEHEALVKARLEADYLRAAIERHRERRGTFAVWKGDRELWGALDRAGDVAALKAEMLEGERGSPPG